MILSIVTGTFNRLDYLRAMIESCRLQLPVGMDYEFVLVDGGSTDGTLAWCKEQPDVRLIEHGRLYGAIKAFTDGARAAQGDYVLLANDDILFHPRSILRALAYLDAHPTCGAVAFADNRKAPGYEAEGYHVQTIRALKPQYSDIGAGGTVALYMPVDIVYAQVGLFRKALGDAVGWWDMGADAGEQHTYGGDSYLSARLWEMGYSVDALVGCAVDDRIPSDTLRQLNYDTEQKIGSAFYRRFPDGVRIGILPDHSTQREHLRILYLPLYSPGWGRYKHGLFDALAKEGYVYELDYVQRPEAIASILEDWQPHLVLSQFHDTTLISAATLRDLRQRAPSAVWVNWNGDVYSENLLSAGMIDLCRALDLQLTVNADVLSQYIAAGVNAAYWQIGYEPVENPLPKMRKHTLLFMATAYDPRRKALGDLLRQLDSKAGLYGAGWNKPSGDTLYNFAQGAALYRACTIAVSDNLYGDRGFVSNRLFEALAHGAFVLQQHIPGLEDLTGIIPGKHLVEWEDFDDLRAKIEAYLPDEPARRRIAAAGQGYVREHCSFEARVNELFDRLLPSISGATIASTGIEDSGRFDGLQAAIAGDIWGTPAP